MEEHSRYIIKRVIEYGMLNDWNIINKYYGLDRIIETAKTFSDLEPRALAYFDDAEEEPYS